MPFHVHLLGTGASLNYGRRLTTMLAVEHGEDVLLVDCGSNVAQALSVAGLALEAVRALIVTHEHLDHTSSFPLLVQQLRLAGRTEPLHVYGPEPAIDLVRRMLGQYDTSGWEVSLEIVYHPVPLDPGIPIPIPLDLTLTAAPGRHSKPILGLRVEAPDGGVLAYSADTEPAPEIIALARDADLLIHEATGDHAGHSTGADAGRVASEAGVDTLALVHLVGDAAGAEQVAAEARKYFGGTVVAGEDGTSFRVG